MPITSPEELISARLNCRGLMRAIGLDAVETLVGKSPGC